MRSIILFLLAAVIACGGTKPPVSRPVAETFRAAVTKFEKRKFENARLLFESVIFENPGSVWADSALYLVGMCYFNQKEFELAAGEFQRFFTQYPTSPLVDEATLMRARSFYRGAPKNTGLDQHYTELCVRILLAFKDDYPTSDLLPAADSLLAASWERLSKKDFKAGKLYYRMRAYSAARVYFQLVLDEFPQSPLVPETIFLIGETFRRRKMNDSAVVWYEKLIYLHPQASITGKAKKRIAKLRPLLPERSPNPPSEAP